MQDVEYFWTMKNGEKINVNNMTEGHLRNALKMVIKKQSFKYKGLVFHNVKDNLFQTDKFGDKLVYELKNNNYHLIVDKRLNEIISTDEICSNPSSMNADDYWWD